MKILFTGYHNPNFATITEYIEDAIEYLGHECISFDDRSFILSRRFHQLSQFLYRQDVNILNNRLQARIKKINPNILLVLGGDRVLPETIEFAKSLGVKTVLWTTDPPVNFVPVVRCAMSCDYVLCAGTEAMELLNQVGIKNSYWLPFACDGLSHKKVDISGEERKVYSSDVAFVGSFYPNRFDVLSELADLDLSIWGPGWEENMPKEHPLYECIKGGQTLPEEWLKIFSSSNIVIVSHYQDGKTLCYQASPKVYEAMACGATVLCDRQKDAQTLFVENEDIVFYDSASEIGHKVAELLTYPDWCKQIGNSAMAKVLESHTYVNRIQKLMEIICPQK